LRRDGIPRPGNANGGPQSRRLEDPTVSHTTIKMMPEPSTNGNGQHPSIPLLRRARLELRRAIAAGGPPELHAIHAAVEDALIEAIQRERRER
jgi:hypothetical protein